jgi:hypothetical protein
VYVGGSCGIEHNITVINKIGIEVLFCVKLVNSPFIDSTVNQYSVSEREVREFTYFGGGTQNE